MNIPKELKYTKDHEWLMELADGAVRVGITDFAQEALGDLVYVGLPEVGSQMGIGDQLGDVESVKAVSDVFSPVAGTVRAVNEALLDAPETINNTPYEAWLAEISDVTDTTELLSAGEYEAFCAKEG